MPGQIIWQWRNALYTHTYTYCVYLSEKYKWLSNMYNVIPVFKKQKHNYIYLDNSNAFKWMTQCVYELEEWHISITADIY